MAEIQRKEIQKIVYTLILDPEEFVVLTIAILPGRAFALTKEEQEILDNIYVVTNGVR